MSNEEKRPTYVPKEGLFFDIQPQTNKSRIWCHGKVMPGITKATIILDPTDGLTRAHVELIMFSGHASIAEEQIKITKRSPNNAPWGVTGEEKPAEVHAEKLKEQEKRLQPYPYGAATSAASIQTQIAQFQLGGIFPFYDVTVEESLRSVSVLVDAKITMEDSATLFNMEINPLQELKDLVQNIIPAGCAAKVSVLVGIDPP